MAQIGLDPWHPLLGHGIHGTVFVGQKSIAMDVGAFDVRGFGHYFWFSNKKLAPL